MMGAGRRAEGGMGKKVGGRRGALEVVLATFLELLVAASGAPFLAAPLEGVTRAP